MAVIKAVSSKAGITQALDYVRRENGEKVGFRPGVYAGVGKR